MSVTPALRRIGTEASLGLQVPASERARAHTHTPTYKYTPQNKNKEIKQFG